MNWKKTYIVFNIVLAILFWLFFYFSWIFLKELFVWNSIPYWEKVVLLIFLYFFRVFIFIPFIAIMIFSWFILQWNFFLIILVNVFWLFLWMVQLRIIWKLFSEEIYKRKKLAKKVEKYKEKVGFKSIVGASLLIVFPIDVIYLASSILNYNIYLYFTAWILWELPFIVLFAYFWNLDILTNKFFLWVGIVITILFLWFKIYEFKKSRN